MARYKKADNPYRECIYEGVPCVEFETVGKTKCTVLVDKDDWYSYLKNHSWTAISQKNRINVKTSVDKQSQMIWRMIIQHRCSELDYWGTTIDHINNNPLDNRFCNLRVFNTSILNSTNISSKFTVMDMQYIYRQGDASNPNGYKVHYNLAGETYYKHFGASEYGSIDNALQEAKKYRDNIVISQREKIIEEMIKKTRDIEFERGLRDKIKAGEILEIKDVLMKYGIHDY